MASEKRYRRQLARNVFSLLLLPHQGDQLWEMHLCQSCWDSCEGLTMIPERRHWCQNWLEVTKQPLIKICRTLTDETYMLSLIPAASSLRDIVCKLFYILVQKRFTKQLETLTRCKAQWRRLKTGDNPTEGLTPTSTLAAWHSEVAASLKVSQDDQVMSSR